MLVHDLANIIKYDLSSKGVLLLTPADRKKVDIWRNLKVKAIAKYGKDPEKATIKIIEELNLSECIVPLLKKISKMRKNVTYLIRLPAEKDPELAICLYSDCRVGPRGVISVNERLNDAFARYGVSDPKRRERTLSTISEFEKQLFRNMTIRPDSISGSAVNRYALSFLNGKFKASG